MIEHLLKEHPRPQMLSVPVRRRVRALKQLQTKFVESEAKFFREVHLLECKFENKAFPLMERRKEIISGLSEPTEEEASKFPDDISMLAWEIDPKEITPDLKGIPYFWYTVLRSIPVMADMISPVDEPILKCLTDIRSNVTMDPMSFRLEFEFLPNDYFKNKILYKNYFLKCEPNADSPFEFDGSEIYKCETGKIDWKPGKNVTIKTVMKKQRHRTGSNIRTVTKTVQVRSFFNFFNIPREDAEEDALDKGHAYDYEIATYLRERVIPRAVLYFTGEAFAEESDSGEEAVYETDKDHDVEEEKSASDSELESE
ncbi:nucleosome assembly protein 1-like 1 [Cimex lectularius]|uniref:Nucleosome assembly protein 1-like 4 n=1 Tax=Cimex lectularius TaxID=79782 RepID=A0A8I6SCB0_CIMLE|nr:nucleosome assembly protein 1-like 1 [Cimex lectularius]